MGDFSVVDLTGDEEDESFSHLPRSAATAGKTNQRQITDIVDLTNGDGEVLPIKVRHLTDI